MTQFIKLALAEYNDDGIPEDIDADDQWINRAHIERIRERLADDHARAHATGREPAYYPALEIIMTSGQEHLVFLGACHTIEAAEEATRRFMPLLIADTSTRHPEGALSKRS